MGEETKPKAGESGGRLLSLDVFRGATIAAMILVNNAGDWKHVFPPLSHAEWHGCTFTDLIFPFFLFIMGVAMTFSFGRRLSEPGGRVALLNQIGRRTLWLFALGFGLNVVTFFALRVKHWDHLRILGVLQRIGLCYGMASLIALQFRTAGRAVWAGALLIGYYLAMKWVPAPGVPEPGHGILAQTRQPGQLDRHELLGRHCYEIDEKTGWMHDPEGLLSTLPALATTLSGMLAGAWIRRKDIENSLKVSGLFAAGGVLLVLAWIWQIDFPFNKNIWTRRTFFSRVAGRASR